MNIPIVHLCYNQQKYLSYLNLTLVQHLLDINKSKMKFVPLLLPVYLALAASAADDCKTIYGDKCFPREKQARENFIQ